LQQAGFYFLQHRQILLNDSNGLLNAPKSCFRDRSSVFDLGGCGKLSNPESKHRQVPGKPLREIVRARTIQIQPNQLSSFFQNTTIADPYRLFPHTNCYQQMTCIGLLSWQCDSPVVWNGIDAISIAIAAGPAWICGSDEVKSTEETKR
jgi:hypothetical protein